MNKVLIIPPKDEENLYHLYPLILGLQSFLKKEEEDFQIYLMHSYDFKEQSALLKNSIHFIKFDEEELGPVASLKLAERCKELFNLTHSLCFRDDLGALTLQKYLKAKKRYGVGGFQGKLANNHVIEDFSFGKSLDLYLTFLKKFFDIGTPEIAERQREELRSFEPEVENFFKANEVAPFILKIFDTVEEESEEHLLLKTFAKDLEKKIYLWLGKAGECSDSLFMSHGSLVNISEAPAENFDAYLEKSLGVISNRLWVCEMAAFYGLKSILFNEQSVGRDDIFNKEIILIKTIGPGLYQVEEKTEEGTNSEELNIDALNDYLFSLFEL